MQQSHKSFLAAFVILVTAAFGGCQKGGDSAQPAAAVAAPGTGASTDAAGPAKPGQDPEHPVFVFETSAGNFTVELDREKARSTVDNFRNYVDKQFYNDTIFHQALNGTVKAVLAGGYTADLTAKKAFTPVHNEAHNGLKNKRGSIAMFRRPDDCDSATSQFIINLADNERLDFKARTPEDYGYCVFGKVTGGIEVLDQIIQRPVRDTNNFDHLPVENVVIKSVKQLK